MTVSIQSFHDIPNTVIGNLMPDETSLLGDLSYLSAFNKQSPITAESLQKALSKGPFIACGKFGPRCYKDSSSEFKNQIPNRPDLLVHGWKAGASRQSDDKIQHIYQAVIVCGVQKIGERAHVYFALADHLTPVLTNGLDAYQRTPTDSKIYVVSVKRFGESLSEMIRPASKDEIDQIQRITAKLTAFRALTSGLFFRSK